MRVAREVLKISLWRKGCANRPFYHICVVPNRRNLPVEPFDTIGSYDPMPNERGENLMAVDMERLRHWLGKKPCISVGVGNLLGLMGILPISPNVYLTAWKCRNGERKTVQYAIPMKLDRNYWEEIDKVQTSKE